MPPDSLDGSAASKPTVHPPRGTILIVEDNVSIRDIMTHVLTGSGYSALKAGNAIAAIAELSRDQTPPLRLVITDLGLPGMSGRDLIRYLASFRPELKVLCVTAAAAQDGLGIPTQNFLAKPFTLKEFIKKVKQTLGDPTETELRNRKVS